MDDYTTTPDNSSLTMEISMKTTKMRGIPDNVLGPALRNHTQVLNNVVTWIETHERQQRRRDRVAVLFAVALLMLAVWF